VSYIFFVYSYIKQYDMAVINNLDEVPMRFI